MKISMPWKLLHLDTVLADFTVVEGHTDSCVHRHLQLLGHLLGNAWRHGHDDKVAHPELQVQAPCHRDDVLMSQVSSAARRLPGLLLLEMDDRHCNDR
jgi:hypothetical protein